ncbi:MAG TPA: transposase [Verrucomicrobiae bacterium]|nr:transposase [Verrucomicrobiae bacterium]
MSDARQSPLKSAAPDSLTSGLHFRGKLPHLKKEGAVYFVTLRLGDSLPAHEIAKLKHERQVILSQARAAKNPLTWHEEEQLLAWYCDKVEVLLDAGRGACWLSKPKIAKLAADTLNHFNSQRYELRAWVVMPNHIHAVVWPMAEHTLSTILHSWKSFSSRQANKTLKRTGEQFWQTESFDHVIRNPEEQVRLIRYVENNPVKAGFCKRPEDWPWSSASGRPTV